MPSGLEDRAYWVATMDRIARPILGALAQGRLHATMPVETKPGSQVDRRPSTHLEAVGRLLAGMAPWLELPADSSPEGKLRAELLELALVGIDRGTDPGSPDFLNFNQGAQALVDTAFLAHAMLRAPGMLWGQLKPRTRQNVVAALQSSRAIKPGQNNWLLFSAMVEAVMCCFEQDWLMEPVSHAVNKHMEWYKGDGIYGDGPPFHWDYYNSFVIHPMLIDVIEAVGKKTKDFESLRKPVLARAQRYAKILESLISPEGTIPPIGRSLAYRFGTLQLLGQIALRRELPADVAPGQARCGMTAVIRRMIEAPGTFDANGFLQIGFCGHQPNIAQTYISTGSLYLCSVGLLPLGLPPHDEFWTCDPSDWTSVRAWSGKDVSADHAMRDVTVTPIPHAPAQQ
jgi:hypothetical protein